MGVGCGSSCASRRDKRREAILEAAHALFLERGYGATTLGEVVKRSGGSLATLYDLFEGKEGLFRAVVADQCQQISETLEAAEMADRPPAEALRSFAGRIYDEVLAGRGIALLRLVIAEAPHFPELGKVLFASGIEVVQAKVEAYLRRQTEKGLLKIDQPHRAAYVFGDMIIGYHRMRMLCGVPVDLSPEAKQAHLDHAVGAFLRAFAPAA